MSTHPTPPALHGQGLACQRGGRRLFSSLDLSVQAGEVVWLRGDNGRGKTSLLRVLAGLVEPETGTLRWHGVPARTAAAHAVQPLYIAHTNALKDDLTVHEALVFLAQLGAPDDTSTIAHVNQALRRMGLSDMADIAVRALSQGQRRRAALTRLALPRAGTRGQVWLLDEPFDALDQTSTQTLNALLQDHVRANGSVVLTSHQPLGADAPSTTECWLHGDKALASGRITG